MRKTLFQTFAAPLALLAVTLAGLIAGVVADGFWDLAASVALAVPLLAMAGSLFRPWRSTRPPSAP